MADLSKFATKDKADEGAVLPVKVNGIKIPMAIKVFGGDSDAVLEHEKGRVRLLAKKEGKKIEDDDIDDLLESRDEGVLVRIGGIYSYDWEKKAVTDEPLVLFGRELKCDPDSYRYLIRKMPSVKEWILEKSNDRLNFLEHRKKD